MVAYGHSGRCRWSVLLKSLDVASEFSTCGTCDSCLRLAEGRARAPDHENTPSRDCASTKVETRAVPLAQGDAVRVPRYERGVAEAAGDDDVMVVFAGGERRLFMATFFRRAAKKRAITQQSSTVETPS